MAPIPVALDQEGANLSFFEETLPTALIPLSDCREIPYKSPAQTYHQLEKVKPFAVNNNDLSPSSSEVELIIDVDTGKDTDGSELGRKRVVIFSCVFCSEEFKDRKELAYHELAVHTEELNSITCIICDEVTPSIRDWELHMEEKHADRNNMFTCTLCFRSFSQVSKLRLHQKHHKALPNLRVCVECGKTWDVMILKQRKHATDFCLDCFAPLVRKRVKCDHCALTFTTQTALREHMRQESLKCKVCGKTFQTPQKLKLHLKVHDGFTPFACDQCPESYLSESSLRRHNFMEHNKNGQLDCHSCGETFTGTANLKKHLQANPSHMACKDCSKTFTTMSDALGHYFFHENQGQRTCPVCGFVCKNILAMHNHRKQHQTQLIKVEVEKPYACPTCDKRFSTFRSYICHKFSHTGTSLHVVKPKLEPSTSRKSTRATCPKCHKFVTAGNLARHMKMVHGNNDSGLKALGGRDNLERRRCGNCNVVYSTPAGLRKHEKRRSCHNKSHFCKICVKEIHGGKEFLDHLKSHSDQDQVPKVEKSCKADPDDVITKANKTCHFCSRSFLDGSTLRKHLEHEVCKELTCTLCQKVVTGRSAYMKHLSSHSNKDQLQCPKCQKRFASAKSKREHIAKKVCEKKSHIVNKVCGNQLTCTVCQKVLIGQTAYKEHLKTHTDEERFQCSKCHKRFTTIRAKRDHMQKKVCENKTIKEEDESDLIMTKIFMKHTCSICGMAFNTATGLKAHSSFHDEDSVLAAVKTEEAEEKPVVPNRPCLCKRSPAVSVKKSEEVSAKGGKGELGKVKALGKIRRCLKCGFTTLSKDLLKCHARVHLERLPKHKF